ncbi:IS200/IS605 family transposase [Lacihabitans sp. CCS-44]|uniref:IS200/IS605 family transposase n=1 Tax=Lacihabitans sp. CCS-44 TaxID=2487331 RepID=UPI0020CEFEC6|nr:IS200/IS605 family transposase [Lacihabitans sp. CCS-44]MCP9756142.1 IS200/IS605 family transposase [Lacihabitans sp. CCS-44]
MADTYRKVYLHVVFAVKNRKALLDKSWRNELFAYMAATLNKRGHFSLAVNGYHDHVHLFFDYNCKELISDLVREIKKSSNEFVTAGRFCSTKFEWQNGYGVFSNGHREKDTIIKYIVNQEKHHSKRSFKEEYLSLLASYNVEYKNEYVFEFFDEAK